ncbi:hypothetical protein F9C07_2384 [Aspergillus flavus]|uniref:Uncharacterized protein n=5 Tax=Aspergillus subgen. Circumdati TaxID=2720871 RepID=B8N1E4_ASPFN|nr:unnamed protein product [Aspergillus oryzae RIB40]XP_041143219.1 uncharacterized protein G4B84_003505 [Aspergillus flavus NRRL3357]EIT83229.1 hypothetical protein Ao3042_11552 [Aspergillus oryzae 3.042]KAB8243457.1 hypothetical protein BDV35DRAFT_407636 [Aspergillus flavus]KDE80188.1 hypothetical protein AO1008_06860 [Aspergillus oryzae 100-8]OOO10160.1 hypothetical protein OAory_01059680 [Aspergillus oryzae]KAF7619243.1 hypothetical protein AFLA_000874 [Aspergillus flavus NRRL3357]|eukprot:EIT83229.1 hypothetical protein Ao3042_11552 [Aspergillus oryzae 3.042]
MELFRLCPTPPPEHSEEDNSASAIEIPMNTHGYGLLDEKAKEITDTEKRRVEELMQQFTKGFDPGSFPREVMDSLPLLSDNLFPGSYAHLSIILLENCGKMQGIQANLENWIRERYKRWAITFPDDTSITDETFFGAEFEMLRKLLAPLRGEDAARVYWMNSRYPHIVKVCQQLEASVKVIEEFKQDILGAIKSKDEHKTIYSPLPVSQARAAMMSMRDIRLRACRASLSWDGFSESDIELTVFHQYYKNHLARSDPAKARASGWLPPSSPKTPRASAEEAEPGDLAHWPSEDSNNVSLNLMLKTALWLSVARGLAAVHLFCDIARHFTVHKPSARANDSYISYLLHLTQIRISVDGVRSRRSTPFPYRDEALSRCNPDYFGDVWRSNQSLTADLVGNVSFYKGSDENFKLADAPPPRRSFRKEMRTLEQTVAIQGSLAGTSSPVDVRPRGRHVLGSGMIGRIEAPQPTHLPATVPALTRAIERITLAEAHERPLIKQATSMHGKKP